MKSTELLTNSTNSSSHEVFLSYKLKKDNQSKTPWKNRNRDVITHNLLIS